MPGANMKNVNAGVMRMVKIKIDIKNRKKAAFLENFLNWFIETHPEILIEAAKKVISDRAIY